MLRLWELEPALTAAFSNFRIVRDGVWLPETKFGDAPAGFWDGMDVLEEGSSGVFRRPMVRELIDFNPLFVSCMVARADFLAAIGGWDEAVNRKMSQDFATTLRVAEHPPIGFVLAPTAGIRKHRGNFSGDVQAMNLGDAAILEHVLATRPSVHVHADAIRESIRARRLDALDLAFARRDFASVVAIAGQLGEAAMPGQARLKAAVARLPAPARGLVVPPLLALGTLRSRLR
jgi:hypothetical protein